MNILVYTTVLKFRDFEKTNIRAEAIRGFPGTCECFMDGYGYYCNYTTAG
jgi:hypothetical protein